MEWPPGRWSGCCCSRTAGATSQSLSFHLCLPPKGCTQSPLEGIFAAKEHVPLPDVVVWAECNKGIVGVVVNVKNKASDIEVTLTARQQNGSPDITTTAVCQLANLLGGNNESCRCCSLRSLCRSASCSLSCCLHVCKHGASQDLGKMSMQLSPQF